jgi:4-amino-4-deoxy-L-arabinose transferase-like glycosyltransferase
MLNSISCLNDKNARTLLLFFFIYLMAWTLLATLLPTSMDLDSVEQVIWSRTAQWGYYKHPPLPSVLMFALNQPFGGATQGMMVFAAQTGNIIALLYVWLLARRILSPQLAIVAVLITSLIAYHNFRAIVFNHNTVSLPFTAAIIYYFYCALRQPERLVMWFLLGVAGGLAMLTKYSAILVLASVFIYVLWQGLWKNPLIVRGLLISVLTFSVIFAPHIFWLIEHDWLPFTYIDKQLTPSDGRLYLLADFLVNQGIRWWYTLLAVLLLIRISPKLATTETVINHDDRRFLLVMQFAPLLLAMLPLLLNGNALNSNWVSAFFTPAGILLVHYFFQHCDAQQLLNNTQKVVWSVHAIILVIFFSAAVIYPAQVGRSARTNYPSSQLAETAASIWHEHESQPLRIVIAENWLGGNVLLHTRPEPLLLIDNDTSISLWLNRDNVAQCGALVLASLADRDTPVYTDSFKQAKVTGTFALNWGKPPRGKVEQIAWAIISPASGAQCGLSQ